MLLGIAGVVLGSFGGCGNFTTLLDEITQIIEGEEGSTSENTPPSVPSGDSPAPPTPPENTPTPPQTPAPVLKIFSWNVANFGQSKNDSELDFIAQQLNTADMVALQEVSVQEQGAAAVAKLVDILNRKGSRWAYSVSQPTSGAGSERYAFLWKESKITMVGNIWNVTAQGLADKLDREPCLAKFKASERNFTIANFHAVPTSKNPASEVVYLAQLHNIYRKENLIIAGDFNLSEKDKAFDDLKEKKYSPVLKNQRTSLRKTVEPNGNYLSQEYDNIFIETAPFVLLRSGTNDFVPQCKNLLQANEISDHLPVWCELKIN